MDYIVKNDYDFIMYDALSENGRIIYGIKIILTFLGVPVSFIEKVIRFITRYKTIIMIIAGLCLFAICSVLFIYRFTHLVLIVVLLLLDYYYRTNALIIPF